ncbi:MAG: hypothetical protein A2W90_20430 [Bacteroidetes bacterium GWF2_42_66]|nr:MAG: hypothetical protein A2W92_06295 [Bacteroidetes bacterium GWA2_42_15]OFX98479.1 MAG: hypothetical protein A2W89_08795 [Bacteroidetes bacterium GWE2_42_39]OFY42864.1 MAG: hypothetical protein A2W90_20430 [Bacteroidetes bacterium GWF2_42_66]HBL74493.1 hypothetical protein [Prolixibacteraceae bacterium]HCR89031.1 hypothetical protein [Prolixibacteraceae bacterium]
MRKKEPPRKFGISFNDVIAKSQSIQPLYMQDLNSFTSFDPSFTSVLGEELLTETREALEDFSGSSHMAEINRATEKITGLLDDSAKVYQKLIYFVHSSFGSTKAIDNTFGRYQYLKARKSEKLMVPLLKQAAKAASLEQFKSGLEAQGMPPRLIQEIEHLAELLAEADDQQEMLKKQQLLVTSQRIDLYNSIWDKLVKINTAAKIIFIDDAARMAIYKLYDGKPSETEITETGEETTEG